jgi:hypothetical protein
MRYLLITFVKRPPGKNNETLGQIDEMVTVATKLKKSDDTVNVILDYQEKKVVKCVINGSVVDTGWDKLNDYYRQVYPNLISQLEKDATPSEK